jgi:hypothetical protein
VDYLGIFDDVAGVLDFDEKAVGWSMVTHPRTEQVVSVLRMTIAMRKPALRVSCTPRRAECRLRVAARTPRLWP